MDLKKVEEVARKIQETLFKNGQGMSTGLIKSSFKGTGLTFKEHQVYSYGDDVKFIDWKILAKLGHPYIRTFEEDRNVEIVVLIDDSPTMSYGFNGISKFQASLEMCFLLMLNCKKSGDTVQPVLFGKKVEIFKASSGKKGMVDFIGHLMKRGYLNPSGDIVSGENSYVRFGNADDDKKVEKQILSLLTRHREVVILSDFKNFLPEKVIKKFIYKRNVHAFQILSPIDEMEKLPFRTYIQNIKQGIGKRGNLIDILGEKVERDDEKITKTDWKKKIKKIILNQSYLEKFVQDLR